MAAKKKKPAKKPTTKPKYVDPLFKMRNISGKTGASTKSKKVTSKQKRKKV